MRIGILGGGQLARMLALAGHSLGYRSVVLCPEPDPPAAPVAEILQGDYGDAQAIRRLREQTDVITFEFENVPAHILTKSDNGVFQPPIKALEISQDRLLEKNLFRELGIPTAPFVPINSVENSLKERLPFPGILKTRRLGYDGKGQRRVHNDSELRKAFEELGSVPCILEGVVDFERELSILAVRSTTKELVVYPLAENTHHHGILRISRAPALVSDSTASSAREIAMAILGRLDYSGVLAVEMFEKDGTLYANEIAPRVHNSGHWTQNGARTSQFENHMRAVVGAPLGSTESHSPTVMVNLIGSVPSAAKLLKIPGLSLHLYGKTPRPNRKLGHVNITPSSGANFETTVDHVKTLVGVS